MLYEKINFAFDTIKKMLSNKEPQETIISLVENLEKEIFKDAISTDIINCKSCELCNCNHTPFAGNINAEIMLVGEAPGEQEEKSGEPFVGPAGELLTRMLNSASEKINPRWNREQIYITNIVKCRCTDKEGHNRQPDLKEIATCRQFLSKEIKMVNPKIIICVGVTAANVIIHPNFKMGEEHGKMFNDGTQLMAIYHPSHILRIGEETDQGVNLKISMWEDILKANEYLDEH